MIKRIKTMSAVMSAMILLAGTALPEVASGDDPNPDAATCVTSIPIWRIKKIEVVDDQTIRFHMMGNQIWENRLPLPCQGLKFEGWMHFKTSLDNLYSTDIITVLRRNTPCGLGYFTLVEKDPGTHSDSNKER